MVNAIKHFRPLKLRKVDERRANVEQTREKTNSVIDEVTSVNGPRSSQKGTPLPQEDKEQNSGGKTPDKNVDDSPTKKNALSASNRREKETSRREQRTPSSTPKRTFASHSNGKKTIGVPGCCVSTQDKSVHAPQRRKEILNIPSAKRRLLMGLNLPDVNEQNYLSCPAMVKCKVTTGASFIFLLLDSNLIVMVLNLACYCWM